MTRELSQEIVKNRVSAAEMQRDKSNRRPVIEQIESRLLMITADDIRGSMTVEIASVLLSHVTIMYSTYRSNN